MRRTRLIIAASMALVLLAGTVPIAAQDVIGQAQRNIEQARQAAEQVKRASAQAAAEMDVARAADAEVVAALTEVNDWIASQEAKLAAAELALTTAESDRAEALARADELDAEIAALKDEMAVRAVEAYIRKSDPDPFLLESGDPNLSAQRNYLVSELNGTTADVADQLRRANDDAEAARTAAENAAVVATDERVEVDARLAELGEARAAQERIKAEIDRRIAELDQQSAVLAAESQRISSFIQQQQGVIQAEIARQAAIAEAQRRAAEEAARQRALAEQGGGGGGGGSVPIGADGLPIDGQVTSGYGNRNHPIFGVERFHAGIDIDGNTGDPIGVTGDGTVIKVEWIDGYGNTVIVDHGDGTSTLYAHMSDFNATVGQTVSEGDTIGYVGSTGWSTGPHVHYEVRVDGEPVDPLGAH